MLLSGLMGRSDPPLQAIRRIGALFNSLEWAGAGKFRLGTRFPNRMLSSCARVSQPARVPRVSVATLGPSFVLRGIVLSGIGGLQTVASASSGTSPSLGRR